MNKIRVYQIVDQVSEGVISTFVAPNVKFAQREFKRLLSDPKLKDFFDPVDFYLVSSDEVDVCDSYADSVNLSLVCCGSELFPESDCPENCSDDCSDCVRKKF